MTYIHYRDQIEDWIDKINRLTGQPMEWDALGHFSLEGSPGNRRLARNTAANAGSSMPSVVQGESCGPTMTETEILKALWLAADIVETLNRTPNY